MKAIAVLLAVLLAVLSTFALPNGFRADARSTSFAWPLDPRPHVTSAFDPPEFDWLPGHRGVDLAGQDRQAVHSAGEGVVVFAGTIAGKPVVSVDHPNGLRTTYEPVEAVVAKGTRVQTDDVIGRLVAGHQGCATPCLHWGVRRGSEYLDPLALVRTDPVRLKPLRPG